jgi:hypothetical protein
MTYKVVSSSHVAGQPYLIFQSYLPFDIMYHVQPRVALIGQCSLLRLPRLYHVLGYRRASPVNFVNLLCVTSY